MYFSRYFSPLFYSIALSLPFFAANATGSVDFLEVDDDVVLFSLSSAKQQTSPDCVSPATANLWSVSLASDSGRAIYSLMLTGMAKGNMDVNVQSAGDCAVREGIERASKVNLVAAQSTGQSYSIGVYKSDGVTRLGTYTGTSSYTYGYVGTDGIATAPKPGVDIRLYFLTDDCTGDAYTKSSYITNFPDRIRHEDHLNEVFLWGDINNQVLVGYGSYLASGGSCTVIEDGGPSWLVKVLPTPNSVCGDYACVLLQD